MKTLTSFTEQLTSSVGTFGGNPIRVISGGNMTGEEKEAGQQQEAAAAGFVKGIQAGIPSRLHRQFIIKLSFLAGVEI